MVQGQAAHEKGPPALLMSPAGQVASWFNASRLSAGLVGRRLRRPASTQSVISGLLAQAREVDVSGAGKEKRLPAVFDVPIIPDEGRFFILSVKGTWLRRFALLAAKHRGHWLTPGIAIDSSH